MNTFSSGAIAQAFNSVGTYNFKIENLSQAVINSQYRIKEVKTDDLELRDFLFTLGCYKGELVTLISILSENYVISVKDARYSIDKELAESILV